MLNSVRAFPFWYFAGFCWIKAYTVAARKIGIKPWLYATAFFFVFNLLPAVGVQISTPTGFIGTYGTPDFKEVPAPVEGCFYIDSVVPGMSVWKEYMMYMIGPWMYSSPFTCFCIGPFYWFGLHCGPKILPAVRTFAQMVMSQLPDVSSTNWIVYISFHITRLLCVAISLFGVHWLSPTKAPVQSCTDYRKVGTIHGLRLSLSWIVFTGLSNLILYACILLLAYGQHWKTAGKSVIGSYYFHIWTPYVWYTPIICLNAYRTTLQWIQYNAPQDATMRTLSAFVQVLFMFGFPWLFMLVAGPFFMVGFVPLMRGMSRHMTD
jgi:hypothetical protein